MKKLKERWGIYSNFQIIIILIVFSITGTSSLFIAKPLIKYAGITPNNLPLMLYWILFILISYISYSILLIFFGWCFGQFTFFWNFKKKILRRIGFRRFLSE